MDLMELLERGDVQAFNAQRPETGKLELFAADLADKELAGVDLSRAILDKSDFTGADLSDATLLGTSLAGIDGSGMKLCRALAMKARLKEAYLDEADISGADFTRANLAEAVLERSNGANAVFAGARLNEANVRGGQWEDVDLVEASLHKVDFTGADLRRADLSEAHAAEAVFSEARLDGAVFAHTRLMGAALAGASLVGARMQGADLTGADLSNADLSNADLTGANLTQAKLDGAVLRGAVLADACLDGVSLEGMDLTGVDLSGVDPTALGLSKAQRGQAAAVGVEVANDLPVRVRGALAATSGGVVAVLWENEDGEEARSLRYAVFGPRKVVNGVLPLPADKILARAIAPQGDGFRVAVLRDRPGGVALVTYRLDAAGAVTGGATANLGYDPMVWPVLDLGRPLAWGLARRGPTLVVHEITPDGAQPFHSERVPTAIGFLGKHHPVLACKGGVLMVAGPRTAGTPRRTPDGFPGRIGTAVPVGDRALCVWAIERVGDTPGGIRLGWLERRGAPQVEVLTTRAAVLSIDALGIGETVWVAWVELTLQGGRVWRCLLPDGDPETLAPEIDARTVSFAPSVGGPPAMVITTAEADVVVIDLKGAVRERA